LYEVASDAKNAEIRERFSSVRGPKSKALADWLHKNINQYDVVLVQGIPFATSVDVVDVCNRYAVPVVVLPHVHIEDRFYHWPEFYRCFRNADAVIAAPAASVPYYFDRIGARSAQLPGGGVNLQEFEPAFSENKQSFFKAIHKERAPFILCLGRKSSTKRYDRIISAHQTLLNRGVDVDLVLIGPDEDGKEIRLDRVYSYGAQPREVVLGALGAAECLVNMSESESFGIVVLESWLSGTPVIVNRNCAAFAELVQDGHDGTLVETDAQLTSAIERYLRDDKLALEHANNGCDKARHYGWANIAASIYDKLQNLANMGKRNSANG
jgi:glycosyltransferase involved in cell wall biosynthesis